MSEQEKETQIKEVPQHWQEVMFKPTKKGLTIWIPWGAIHKGIDTFKETYGTNETDKTN